MSGRSLYVDRIEEDVAIVLDDDGASYLIACALLPADTREGDRVVMRVDIVSRDDSNRSDIAALRSRSSRADDGGDIEL